MGGRAGGVDGDRGGQEEDFTAGGGGLGRHGRTGGLEEGREGGERGADGGMEAEEGMDGVSSDPVRGLVCLFFLVVYSIHLSVTILTCIRVNRGGRFPYTPLKSF